MTKIVLSGVETNNKGAELMLYAILQEIERKFPDACVYLGYRSVRQGYCYINTNVKLKHKPIEKWMSFLDTIKIGGILRALHFMPSFIDDVYSIKNAEYFIDGSGLLFCDNLFNSKFMLNRWQKLLLRTKSAGSKIIFLPQAFGPITNTYAKESIKLLGNTADIVFSRDSISYNYLLETKNIDMAKVKQYPDFTSLVAGVVPPQYEHLKGAVCIIPNIQMITQLKFSESDYIDFLKRIVVHIQAKHKKVFLLNHEGVDDEKIAYACQKVCNYNIEVVTKLNALEVKGLISISYLVITSRFHGAVSALNSAVPCLATSWSHKYSELFKEYNQNNCILPIDNIDKCFSCIDDFLIPSHNNQISKALMVESSRIKNKNKDMWDIVWSV